MNTNRIMRAVRVRRALLLALALAVAALALGACGGGGGDSSSAVAEGEADAVVLNEVLARQDAVVTVYDQILHGLGGGSLAAARLFRAQEQEHVDGTLKALRALGAEAEPEAETIDAEELHSEVEYLEFLYELENETIVSELSAIAELNGPGARSMLAATVANQGQHLVILRRDLGAKPLETVPVPFENGTTPAP